MVPVTVMWCLNPGRFATARKRGGRGSLPDFVERVEPERYNRLHPK